MVEGWSGSAPYGTDMWARQRAEQAYTAATAAAATATGRGCRLSSAKTGLLVAVGGTSDVTVNWLTPITVPYVVEPVAGPGLIGQANLSVKSQSETGCVIAVQAVGLAIAAGATVLAHATF